jgi:hypothetical protein
MVSSKNISLIILKVFVLNQVQGFPSNATVSIVVYYFIQIIHYMFRSYDHLQVEIYSSEINMTGLSVCCSLKLL